MHDQPPGPEVQRKSEEAGVPSAPRRDRRAFLKQAGVAGAGLGVAGATWAAPSMLAMDRAYAVGSCSSGGLLDLRLARGKEPTVVTSGVVGTTTTGGIDVQITAHTSSNVANAGLVMNNWKVRTSATGAYTCNGNADYRMGNATSFYSLEMSGSTTNCLAAGTAGRYVTVTLAFFDHGTTTPHAVRNLNFTLLDVDYINGYYHDEVRIFTNTALVTGTPASTGVGGVFPTVSIPTGGTSPSPPPARRSSTGTATWVRRHNGNLTLTSNATTNITSITFQFVNIGGTPNSIQCVGISDLTFCKV